MILLGKASNEAKHRWNSEHYTQVKLSVKSEIAAYFKANCFARGVSMASEITRFMAEKIGEPCQYQSPKPIHRVETRPQRRKAVKHILELLGHIIDAETQYMDNIPQNLKNSRNYEIYSVTDRFSTKQHLTSRQTKTFFTFLENVFVRGYNKNIRAFIPHSYLQRTSCGASPSSKANPPRRSPVCGLVQALRLRFTKAITPLSHCKQAFAV